MPTYCYECPMCLRMREVVRPMKDSDSVEVCECGEIMGRDYQTEYHSVRGDYNEPIVSTSMAFDTQDLDEHRKRHPDIELDVDKVGHTAYPIFHNLSQKRAYMKARGWVDCNSFI